MDTKNILKRTITSGSNSSFIPPSSPQSSATSLVTTEHHVQSLLKDLETWDIQLKQPSTTLSDSLRNLYTMVVEDLVQLDIQSVDTKEVLERCWAAVFYKRIEVVRKQLTSNNSNNNNNSNVISELKHILSTAKSFYKSLVITLRSELLVNPTNTNNDETHQLKTISLHHFQSPSTTTTTTTSSSIIKSLQYCFICLGDLARYETEYIHSRTSTSSSTRQWKSVLEYYAKALQIDPNTSTSYAKIGYVGKRCLRDLEALYWYAISIASTTTNLLNRKNVKTWFTNLQTSFTQHAGQNKTKVLNVSPSIASFTIPFFEWMLCFWVDDGSSQQQKSLETIGIDCYKPLLESLTQTLQHHLTITTQQSTTLIQSLNKLILITIAMLHEHDTRFRETSSSAYKQRIRYLQTFLHGFLFDLLESISGLITGYLMSKDELNGDCIPITERFMAFFEMTSEESDTVNVQFLRWLFTPLAILMIYFSTQPDQIQKYLEYTTTPPQSSTEELTKLFKKLNKKFYKAFRSATDLYNALLPYVDEDLFGCLVGENDEVFPVVMVGMVPFREYFVNSVSEVCLGNVFNGLRDAVFNDEDDIEVEDGDADYLDIRIANLVSSLKHLSTHPTFTHHLTLDPQSSLYIFNDDLQKRKQRLQTSQKLAQERLQTQVTHLENKLLKSSLNIPLILLSSDMFLFWLKELKQWVNARVACFVVPLAVINHLDTLKKGKAEININARESMRFLEQRLKYRSPFLIAQNPMQTLPLSFDLASYYYAKNSYDDEDEEMDEGIDEYSLAKLKVLLECWNWFGNDISQRNETIGDGRKVVVVTQELELLELAGKMGLRALRPEEWGVEFKGILNERGGRHGGGRKGGHRNGRDRGRG